MGEKRDMDLLDESELSKVSGGVDEVFSKVQGIFTAKLGLSAGAVSLQSSIVEELGADSLDVVDIVSCTEDMLNVSIKRSEVGNIRTVGDLCDLVQNSK